MLIQFVLKWVRGGYSPPDVTRQKILSFLASRANGEKHWDLQCIWKEKRSITLLTFAVAVGSFRQEEQGKWDTTPPPDLTRPLVARSTAHPKWLILTDPQCISWVGIGNHYASMVLFCHFFPFLPLYFLADFSQFHPSVNSAFPSTNFYSINHFLSHFILGKGKGSPWHLVQ